MTFKIFFYFGDIENGLVMVFISFILPINSIFGEYIFINNLILI